MNAKNAFAALIAVAMVIIFTIPNEQIGVEGAGDEGFIPSTVDPKLDILQFGTDQDDKREAGDNTHSPVIVTHETGIYVAGESMGVFPDTSDVYDWDCYLIKYDFDGIVQWRRIFGTNGTDTVMGMTIDSSYIYICGATDSNFPSYSNDGNWDGFIVKFDLLGNELGHHQFGNITDHQPWDIGVIAGRIFVMGRYTSSSNPHLFIKEFSHNPDGSWEEVKDDRIHTGQAYFSPGDLCVYKARIFITGYVGDSAEFSSRIPFNSREENRGGWDCFVMSYDIFNGVEWINRFGGLTVNNSPSDDRAYGIHVDGSGIYVTGNTQGSFEGYDNPESNEDTFVRRYNMDGSEVMWTRQIESSDENSGKALVTDREHVYCTGFIQGQINTAYDEWGGLDSYVMKIDKGTGVLQSDWTIQFGSNATDIPWSISMFSSDIYISGQVEGPLCGIGPTFGSIDSYVVRINETEPDDEEEDCPPCPPCDQCLIIIIIVLIIIIMILIIIILILRRR